MVDVTRILETKFNTPDHYLALEEGRASNRNSASVAVVARRKRRRRVASFPAYRGGGMAALDAPPAAAVPKSSLPHTVRLSSPRISSYVRHASHRLSSHPTALGMGLELGRRRYVDF